VRSRWVVLAAGTAAQASQAAAVSGLAVLAPVLRDRYGLSLTQVGVLLGGTSVGSLLTFLAWGLLADRVGERTTSTIGLTGSAVGLAGAAFAPDFPALVVILALAVASGACVNTATARAVTSWFPRSERAFALGIRQTSVPLGGFAAALAIPPLADLWGSRGALLAIAGYTLFGAAACGVLLTEGPQHLHHEFEAGTLRHPLRDRRIWRLSLGSSFLLVAQVVLTGFVVLFLESERGFSHGQAGAVLAGMNVLAVAGRLVAGKLSDRLGHRLALMRKIAVATAVATAVAAGVLGAAGWLLVTALVVGGGLSMSWNGLAVTAAIESARAGRSGAALGLQQTMLGVTVVAAPLAFAPFVAATSWRAGFAAVAAFPLVAVAVLRRLDR
jgi:sugar phosphate permease